MADLDPTLHKARAKAASAARTLKSTERAAAAAKKSAQRAKLALKKAKKASKMARKVARKAGRALDAASKALDKATTRVKRAEARSVKTEGAPEKRQEAAVRGAAPTKVTPTRAAAQARVHRRAGARPRKRSRRVPSPAIAPAVSAVEPSDEGDTFLLGESTLN